MQTPDSDGFVNVMWPSKNVPHGGIFHTRVVNSTSEQQNFLKVLLEESRLDTKLRHAKDYKYRNDSRQSSSRAESAAVERGREMPMTRPHTSRRRSLSAIRQASLQNDEEYHPLKKGEDREKLKDKLANTMAYGDTPCQMVPAIHGQKKPAKDERKLPTQKQKWNELVTQIRERAEWLAEMEYLGEGAAHREVINDQIAERMRLLDALGIDSQCSTARSSCSGFSTTRSREGTANAVLPHTRLGTAHSKYSMTTVASNGSIGSKTTGKVMVKKRSGGKKAPADENVAAYTLCPLRYSPRRRM